MASAFLTCFTGPMIKTYKMITKKKTSGICTEGSSRFSNHIKKKKNPKKARKKAVPNFISIKIPQFLGFACSQLRQIAIRLFTHVATLRLSLPLSFF